MDDPAILHRSAFTTLQRHHSGNVAVSLFATRTISAESGPIAFLEWPSPARGLHIHPSAHRRIGLMRLPSPFARLTHRGARRDHGPYVYEDLPARSHGGHRCRCDGHCHRRHRCLCVVETPRPRPARDRRGRVPERDASSAAPGSGRDSDAGRRCCQPGGRGRTRLHRAGRSGTRRGTDRSGAGGRAQADGDRRLRRAQRRPAAVGCGSESVGGASACDSRSVRDAGRPPPRAADRLARSAVVARARARDPRQ